MHSCRVRSLAIAFVFFTFTSVASAQWPNNPAVNLPIRVDVSDQNQPKIRPTSDGGCYISWFDGIGSGWDVRLQRLDRDGHALWPVGGVLVADLTLSFTNDYGLAVDASDNAVLAFQDTRFGGTRITCSLVASDGTLVWGVNGIQVSTGNGTSPHCAALQDGTYVVGWTEGSNLRRQKLYGNGAIQWAAGGLFEAPPASNSDIICDVIAADGDNVMISWSRNPSRFLHAQKYDANGAPMWNSGNPVVVFDGSALQFGYFPTFVHDGTGGAVFGWYETGGTRNAYIQRISSVGTELYPHNGVAASTVTGTRKRLTPSVAFNASTGDTFLFWVEASNPVENAWGVYGQRFNAAGIRQWTDSAKEIVPLSALQTANVKCVAYPTGGGGGAAVFWSDQPGSAILLGARLDQSGTFVWPGNIITLCSTASGKARLDVSHNGCNEALLTWSDARTDSGDIYAQNVLPNGALGLRCDGELTNDTSVGVPDLLFVINQWGPCALKSPCPADIAPDAACPNGDGAVGVPDLLKIINNWGPCP